MGSVSSERREPGRSLVSLGVLLALAGCGGDGRPDRISAIVQPRDELPARAEELGDDFVQSDCFLDPPSPYAASCGTVAVPESDDDGARDLQLAVMILYKRGDPPPADPVVYLEGGPGGAATGLALSDPFAFEHILDDRDLVLIDQRGTGFSDFALECGSDLDASASRRQQLEALGECFDELTRDGHDLGSYSTRQIAQDFERVRKALGYEEWNLYGISYGSRLALDIARDFPDSIRSVAIDAVLPAEVDFFAEPPLTFAESLDTLAQACEEQYACDETYGDILAKMFDAADRLEEEPAELRLESGDRYLFDGTLWVRTVFDLMYYAEVLPYMPAIIELTDIEDYEFLEELFSALVEVPPLAHGMYYSVVCGEEAPFTSQQAIEDLTGGLNQHILAAVDASTLLEACDYWAVPAGPDEENERVESDLPTLITSGAFDPITPPRFAELAASGLENSYQFVLADQSHGASVSDCGKQLLVDFFDHPKRAPSASCVDALGDPVFEWRAGPRPSLQHGIVFETALTLPEGLASDLAEKLRNRRVLPF